MCLRCVSSCFFVFPSLAYHVFPDFYYKTVVVNAYVFPTIKAKTSRNALCFLCFIAEKVGNAYVFTIWYEPACVNTHVFPTAYITFGF